MAPADISWVAVGAATVLYQALHVLWYSPFVFGKLWAHGLGFEEYHEADRHAFWVGVGITTVATFGVCAALDVLLDWAAVGSAIEGALVGGLAGGVAVLVGAQGIGLEERPILLFMLSALFNLVAMAAAGAVIVLVGGPTAVA